jgi:hypothetical protein
MAAIDASSLTSACGAREVDVGYTDADTGRSQPASADPPNAGAAAGDDADLAVESVHALPQGSLAPRTTAAVGH